MKLSDFVIPEAVIPNLTGTTKEQVIREMVDGLRLTGHVKQEDQEAVVRAMSGRASS